jgi:hypothetical protein
MLHRLVNVPDLSMNIARSLGVTKFTNWLRQGFVKGLEVQALSGNKGCCPAAIPLM